MSNFETFESAQAAVAEAEAQEKAWQAKKRRALAGLRVHVIAALTRYLALFEGLVDEDELPMQPGDHDALWYVDVEGELLTATFYYATRGCDGTHKVEMPARYLQSGGDALMVADAEALRAQKTLAEAAASAQEEADARDQLAQLQARFGTSTLSS